MTTRRAWLAFAALVVLAAIAPLAGAQARLKVAAVYTVPIEQQWVSRIHKALNAAKDRGEIDYVFSEKVANADYERVMREFAEKGNQLIVGESIAGGMTKSNRIGMVGGYPIPEVNRLMHAFMAGAKEVNPKVEFMVTFIGSWFDPPKAKEAAYAMIEKGADVLYAERFGVSDAAKEKGKLAIGNVIDTQKDYPDTVVASALWNMEPTIDTAIKAVKAGSFKAEDYGQYSLMRNKGSQLAPLGTFAAKVPADLQAKVKAKEKDMLDGKFKVAVVETEPKSTAK
jgi:basic membrane protein A